MLTATYTLVTLSVEQAKVRSSLQSLQLLLETNFIHQSSLTPGQVGYACDAVKRLYESCHWRKLDTFLIPAIRKATSSADHVLATLDQLGRAAADAVGELAIRLGSAAVDSVSKVAQFCAAIEAFCSATLQRLDIEEHMLFPVARSVISGEAWFSIANGLMSQDAHAHASRPIRPGPMVTVMPAPSLHQERTAAHVLH